MEETSKRAPAVRTVSKKGIKKETANFKEEDCGLKLFLQPIYEPEKGEVYGYECLLRIVDMELGLLTPSVFLDVAEKHPSLMYRMEDWGFEEICEMLRRMRITHTEVQLLTLNIFSKHLFQPNFLEVIKNIILETGIDPHGIGLEFKEEVLFEDPEYIEKVFGELRALGIVIAIDDFGLEFFSIFDGKVPPVDLVKIDKSYVDTFLENEKSKAVVDKVIGFALENKLDVVAVGVETEEQESMLMSFGCHKMQGYLYSKPMTGKRAVRKKIK